MQNALKVRQFGRFVSFGTADPHKKIPPETAKIVIWWDFLWRKMEDVSAFTRRKRQYISMQKTLFWAIQCRKLFSSCHPLPYALGRLDPGVFHLLPSPARKFPQKTLTNHCPRGNIYRRSVRLRIEYGRVPEWPMGTDCKSAAFSFGGSNPPAPTKKTSVENTLVFVLSGILSFTLKGGFEQLRRRR